MRRYDRARDQWRGGASPGEDARPLASGDGLRAGAAPHREM